MARLAYGCVVGALGGAAVGIILGLALRPFNEWAPLLGGLLGVWIGTAAGLAGIIFRVRVRAGHGRFSAALMALGSGGLLAAALAVTARLAGIVNGEPGNPWWLAIPVEVVVMIAFIARPRAV